VSTVFAVAGFLGGGERAVVGGPIFSIAFLEQLDFVRIKQRRKLSMLEHRRSQQDAVPR